MFRRMNRREYRRLVTQAPRHTFSDDNLRRAKVHGPDSEPGNLGDERVIGADCGADVAEL